MSTATAAAKVAKVPPSSFSVLLRRSRFASYDPQIGQVYTTYDGSAARGDWGLKRPLSVRRRDGRLIISKIDTLYQQTEWESAYSDENAVRKFEELGLTPNLEPGGNWAPRLAVNSKTHRPYGIWTSDPDGIKQPTEKLEKDLERFAPIPEPRAMSPKRLERYLRKIRRLQPEFQEYVESDIRQKQNREPPPLYELAKNPGIRDHERFLSDKFAQEYKAENSTTIRPLPHPTAGLTYAYTTDLQRAIYSKPLPGRRIKFEETKGTVSSRNADVSFAGWVVKETVKTSDPNVTVIDCGTKEGEPRQDREAGKSLFKPMLKSNGSYLIIAPEVVGRYPQRMDAAKLRMQVYHWADANVPRTDARWPGTAEYITPPRPKVKKSVSAPFADYPKPKSNVFLMTSPAYNRRRGAVASAKQQQQNEMVAMLTKMTAQMGNKSEPLDIDDASVLEDGSETDKPTHA